MTKSMQYIKAPYNFVPFNKKVVSPSWATHVSHDVPFEDGLSGTIELTIKAHSPIFVRDGLKNPDKPGEVGQFTKRNGANGNYFIPGSSIKGMIRSVLEVMTFGKMELVNDDRYALRDLSMPKYINKFNGNEVYCGWLMKINNKWMIQDCGKPIWIKHELLKESIGIDFNKLIYGRQSKWYNRKDEKTKICWHKWKKVLSNLDKLKHLKYASKTDKYGKKIASISQNGKEGIPVLTGQPSNSYRKGKKHEFIFPKSTQRAKPVTDSVINNFLFAYHDENENEISEDWRIYKALLNQNESKLNQLELKNTLSKWRRFLGLNESEPTRIPVFFHKTNGQISSLGLSYLYKFPYTKSVKQAISDFQKSRSIDLAEAIFGYTKNSSGKSFGLKGRVHIGHATGIKILKKNDNVIALLNNPKASYYPNYIRQHFKIDKRKLRNGKTKGKHVSKYATFMDENVEIAGWKRYPVHRKLSFKGLSEEDIKGKENLITRFIPIEEKSEFKNTVTFHNLKPIELGALLSAITFHGTENTYHSLGMAKPLGYGKVKVTPEIKLLKQSIGNQLLNDKTINYFLGCFESYIEYKTEIKWLQSDQIKELLTMVTEQDNRKESLLKYMQLENDEKSNDFVLAKTKKIKTGVYWDNGREKEAKIPEALDRYSKLEGIKEVSATSHIQTEANFTGLKSLEEFNEKYLNNPEKNFKEVIEERRSTWQEMINKRRKELQGLERNDDESIDGDETGPNPSTT